MTDAKKNEPKLIKCEILRDFWDAKGDRHRAGTEIEVTVDEALAGVEAGALKRVKAD